MDILILITVGFLLLLGILGSIIPVLPGPILSYIALLLYHFFITNLNNDSLLWMGVAVTFITIFDYFIQIYGVKNAGGGKYAIRGSLIGMLLGMFFFPPVGILTGAFVGAFVGAKIELKQNPLKIAFGAFWGFILGTILKFSYSACVIYFLFF